MRSSGMGSVEKQICCWFSLALHSNVNANSLWSERNTMVNCILYSSCRMTRLKQVFKVHIKYTHTDSWLWHEKYCCFPIKSHPGNSSQSAAEKNLTDFCMSWSKVKNNQTKTPQNLQEHDDGEYILLLSPHFRKPIWGRENWQTEQKHYVPWSCRKCELINDSVFKTQWSLWIDSHTSDTLFHYYFAPPQPSSTLWVLKRNQQSIHFYVLRSVWRKNTCPEVTDEIFLSRFKIPSNISPVNTMPRVEHVNNQG